MDEYEEDLQELITLAKQDGVLPMLTLFPSPHFENAPAVVKEFADKDLNMWGQWDAFVVALDRIRKRLRILAGRNGIPLVDVNSVFEKYNVGYKRKFEFFVDRMHMTDEGERLVAAAMYPCVGAMVDSVWRRKGRDAVLQRNSCKGVETGGSRPGGGRDLQVGAAE